MCVRSQVHWRAGHRPHRADVLPHHAEASSDHIDGCIEADALPHRYLPRATAAVAAFRHQPALGAGLPGIHADQTSRLCTSNGVIPPRGQHHHQSLHWERPGRGPVRANPCVCSLLGNTDAQAAQGKPFTGQLRSELFLCTDHKTLRITEHITRLLCPSSRPGPRHPPQQVKLSQSEKPTPLGTGPEGGHGWFLGGHP